MKRPFWIDLLFLTVTLLVLNCSISKPKETNPNFGKDKEKVIEILTLFVEAVQGDHFEKAFTYLTPTERVKMSGGSEQEASTIKKELKAIRLSTLAQKSGVRLEHGKLTGIFEWLPQLGPSQKVEPRETDTPLIQ